jgi:hypothetical protein
VTRPQHGERRAIGPGTAGCIFLLMLPAAPALAHPGVGIVMDAQGSVYYTDLAQVWRIPPQGPKSVVVPHVHTHELCLDAAGNLYGEHLWYEGEKTDKWGYRVWRRDPSGKVADVVGPREGFRTDYSFVRDAQGNMYWTEGEFPVTVRRKAPDGSLTTVGRCGSCRGGGWMSVVADGTVYFLDGDDLRKMAPDGRLSTAAKHLGSRSLTQPQVGDRHRVMGIWIDAAGNVYAAVYGSREVKRIDPQGRIEVVSRSRFPWSPTGGLTAADGALWILESSLTNQVRVRRVARDGRETIY